MIPDRFYALKLLAALVLAVVGGLIGIIAPSNEVGHIGDWMMVVGAFLGLMLAFSREDFK